MSLTTKCEHRFRESPKRKRSKVHDFAQSANTVRTPIPRAQSGMDGWGAGLSFQSERRNQEWSISRAARTFSRPRNNRSKARTELFIFEKIQDLRRPGRRRADFSFRKSYRPPARSATLRVRPGYNFFRKEKCPRAAPTDFYFIVFAGYELSQIKFFLRVGSNRAVCFHHPFIRDLGRPRMHARTVLFFHHFFTNDLEGAKVIISD